MLLRFLVRMLIAAGTSTAVAALVAHLLRGLVDDPGQLGGARHRARRRWLVDVAVFLVLARLLRLREVTEMHGHRAAAAAVAEAVRRPTMGA